jgi:hypothetical protein
MLDKSSSKKRMAKNSDNVTKNVWQRIVTMSLKMYGKDSDNVTKKRRIKDSDNETKHKDLLLARINNLYYWEVLCIALPTYLYQILLRKKTMNSSR